MPQTPHLERHFTASDIVRDIVIGMADGLTVPFALAAGLSGAVSDPGIIVTAGLVVSVCVTLVALAVFGLIKGRYTGARPLKSAVQTTVTGGLAATAAFLIARAIA